MLSNAILVALWALLLAASIAADALLVSPVPGAGLVVLSFLPLLLLRGARMRLAAALLTSAWLLLPLAMQLPEVLRGVARLDIDELVSRGLGVLIVLSLHEIGRRYQALHRQVRLGEARLRTLVDAASCLVWVGRQGARAGSAELQGRVGGDWQVFTGQRPVDAAGEGWLRCVHEQDRERLRALWSRPDENAWPERHDEVVRVWHASSGSWRSMDARLRPLRDDDGVVCEWVGVFTDAHDRTSLEHALAQGDERAREAQRLARLGPWEYDPATDRVLISAELADAFGGEPVAESLELDEVLRFLVGTPADHIDGLLGRVAREGDGMDGEYTVMLPDGVRRVARIVARRGVGSDGQPIVWGIAQDVTEQARWRERELTLERKLTQSVKMQTVGELSTGLAHDFNNVLASMLGYGELAQHRARERDPELDGYLQRVLDAGRRARDLLRTLMMVGRGNTSPGAEGEAEIEFGAVVAETLNLVRVAMPPGITIVERLDGEVHGRFDRVQLQEAVLNLCINARDAVGSTGTLRVGVRHARIDGDCAVCGERVQDEAAVVSVGDDGPGIDPSVLPRIFEPFFSTKRSGEGTGLGLAMVARLLHGQGAHVLVASRPGDTRFDLVFPARAQGEARPRAAVTPLPRAEPSPAVGGGRFQVLVLDDEAPIGRLVGSAFEQAGITAVVFVDAREALAAFSADPTRFDLIVTDLTMPSLSGIEVATAARRQRQVPVLLLTGGGTADEELHASGAIDLVLRKPFSMRELLMLAMQLLQARGQVPPRVQAS